MPRGPVRIEWADAEHWPPGRFQPDTTYRIATIRPGIEIDASGTMLAFAAETGDNQPTGPVRPHQAVQLAASGFRRMIGPAVDHPDTEVGPPAVIAAVGARLERFATGNTPLLWLSTGQVDALAMSDITDSDLERAGQTDGALGPDGIVIFEEPVPLDVYELMAGDSDPITPKAFSDEIVSSLPKHLVRYEVFERCGHSIFPDDPVNGFRVLREFIQA